MSAALQARLDAAFARAFGGEPAFTIRAPGRVNLIGEHTDYNGGFVLPCAIGPETRLAVRPRTDGTINVVAADFGDEADGFAVEAGIGHHPAGGWRDYVRGMVRALAVAGIVPTGAGQGADIAIAGDIPRGAGLSSSASLMVGVGTALMTAQGMAPDPVRVALLAQGAENDFVGVRCGNMDQLASAASVAGAALLIDCRDLTLVPVPVPADVAIVIVHSGVERGLVDGHYNRRRAACEEAAHTLRVPLLRDASLADLGRLDGEVLRRARHIVTENARVLAAADALRLGDLPALGGLMAESHASMRDDFEITEASVDRLAALMGDAIGTEGGARMTGGGFGGAVVGVMRAAAVDGVLAAVRAGYRTPAGDEPLILVETAAAGAGRVEANGD